MLSSSIKKKSWDTDILSCLKVEHSYKTLHNPKCHEAEYSPFSESSLYVTLLLQKTYISTCFAERIRSFAFIKKGEKWKQHSAPVLPWATVEAARTPDSESGATKRFPWEWYSAFQYQAAIALNWIYEHLCFTLIYFVYLWARYVLRHQKSLRLFFGIW